jgi:hypothetical protein
MELHLSGVLPAQPERQQKQVRRPAPLKIQRKRIDADGGEFCHGRCIMSVLPPIWTL